MTHQEIVRRVQRELADWATARGETPDAAGVTGDDIDELEQALCDVCDACRDDEETGS
jgi:hypothetical protein